MLDGIPYEVLQCWGARNIAEVKPWGSLQKLKLACHLHPTSMYRIVYCPMEPVERRRTYKVLVE